MPTTHRKCLPDLPTRQCRASRRAGEEQREEAEMGDALKRGQRRQRATLPRANPEWWGLVALDKRFQAGESVVPTAGDHVEVTAGFRESRRIQCPNMLPA